MLKFSLIMATLGRDKEVDEVLNSLNNQVYKNFELIIVDQNEDNRVEELYLKYKDSMKIKYIKTNKKGLSVSRNIGLKHVEGNIVAFPDDDCEYPFDILDKVNSFFVNNKGVNILTCKSVDKMHNKDSNGVWLKNKTIIDTNNVLKTAISYTIFIKYINLSDIIFDEKLGVGAEFGSGEESDMLLNLIHKPNYNGLYNPDYYVYHPYKEENHTRVYNYALGFGALIKKEMISRKNYKYIVKFILDIFIKPTVGIALNIFKCDMESIIKYKRKLIGRVKGFILF